MVTFNSCAHEDESWTVENSVQDRADAVAASVIAAAPVVTLVVASPETFAKIVTIGVNVAILVAVT